MGSSNQAVRLNWRLSKDGEMSDLIIQNATRGPKMWTKPRTKVYDINRVSGEFYYQPMLEYIDKKEMVGVDLEFRKKVELGTVLSRLTDFISVYKAKQIKGRNQKTVHTKFEMARGSTSSDTLPDKRSSTIIRDQYINSLVLLYRDGVGQ